MLAEIPDDLAQRIHHSVRLRFPGPSLDQIKASVAREFGVSIPDLASERRHAEIVGPRMIAIYLAKEMTIHTLQRIGQAFNRGHPACCHALDRAAEMIAADHVLARRVDKLRRELNSHG